MTAPVTASDSRRDWWAANFLLAEFIVAVPIGAVFTAWVFAFGGAGSVNATLGPDWGRSPRLW
ncbi:MAG: hypothetical protein WB782_07075 [Thermoplasmata archaeon]